MGSKGQNSTFSEHGHVAYQIKGNHGSSNMVADIMPADPPDPGSHKVKIQVFQNMIQLKMITNAGAGVAKSDSSCRCICIRHRMQETLYQTFNAGVCITNNECRGLYIRQGSICLHMIQWCMFLHCKSCTQESLLQTAAAGVAMSDTGLRCLSNRRL